MSTSSKNPTKHKAASKAAATPAAKPVAAKTAASATSVASIAKAASTAIAKVAASIPFYDPSAKEIQAARVANRVPVTALGVAAKILEDNPGRYPDFDPETTRGACDYATAMMPVATQLDELHQRLARSILNRHGQGAADTLALYQTLKGLARVSKGKDTLTQQKSLAKAMSTTRKKSRATAVTKKDLEGAAKTIKATKVSSTKAKQAAVLNAEAQAAAPASATSTTSASGASAAPTGSSKAGSTPMTN